MIEDIKYFVSFLSSATEEELKEFQDQCKPYSVNFVENESDIEESDEISCYFVLPHPSVVLGPFAFQISVHDYSQPTRLCIPIIGSEKTATLYTFTNSLPSDLIEKNIDTEDGLVYICEKEKIKEMVTNRIHCPCAIPFPTSPEIYNPNSPVCVVRVGDRAVRSILAHFNPEMYPQKSDINGCISLPAIGAAYLNMFDTYTKMEDISRTFFVFKNIELHKHFLLSKNFLEMFPKRKYTKLYDGFINLLLGEPENFKGILEAINSYDCVIYVGPSYSYNIASNPITFDQHITITPKNSWYVRNKVKEQIKNIILENEKRSIAVVLQSGVGLKPILFDLYTETNAFSLIDVGSSLDFFLGRSTRGYIKKNMVKLNSNYEV